MRHTDLIYLLALQKAEGIGDVTIKKLLSHCGDAETVFKTKASLLSRIDGVGKFRIKGLNNKTLFSQAESELDFIQNHNIQVYYFDDDNYPYRLKHCPDGPVLLFGSGNFDWTDRKIISIVGTRQASAYGIESCRKLIADLSPLNPIIVSGFAYGIDIAAHQAAIENNLQTIGVMAHGLDQIYPKAHKKHVKSTLENGGFLTEFWSKTEPTRENFIRRNRIVAGLSEATIVIESAEKGGSLVTANMANDYNRDVFAIPGRTTDRVSRGCNDLIKSQKAMMLTDAADLIYQLNWDLQPAAKPVQQQLFIALDSSEQIVFDFLKSNNKQQLDTIAIACGMTVSKIAPMLLTMELKGAIRPLPGKLFEII
jgi:DNA processing protein